MPAAFQVRTSRRIETVDITGEVQKRIPKDFSGVCVVYTKHTTTAIGINEGADPEVRGDIERNLARLFPHDGDYRHMEGNSDAHLKSILMGPSESIPVEKGSLLLGRWQAVYFCEFDGPRTRTVTLTFLSG